VQNAINSKKGLCMGLIAPFGASTFKRHLTAAINSGSGEDEFLKPLREVIAVWQYLNTPVVKDAILDKRTNLLNAISFVARNATDRSLCNIDAIFREFDVDLWQTAATNCKTVVTQYIQYAHNNYTQYADDNGSTPANWPSVQNTLDHYDIAADIISPPEAPYAH